MQKILTIILLTHLFSAPAYAETSITKAEVLSAQQAWAEGIVHIGKMYQDNGDYTQAAADHIRNLYAYAQGPVLFKPTLAAQDQFRENADQALSYFVGGNIAEDNGFAIKPWAQVHFGKQEIITDSDSAIAMGNYYFTPAGSDEEVKVEYTFGYIKDAEGKLRINVHHSSLPYEE